MKIEIKKIRHRDYKVAIEIIIKELHLDLFIKNKLLQKIYGRYYWYLYMNKATSAYGAFSKTRFMGLLLIEMQNEFTIHDSLFENIYLKIFGFIKKLFLKNLKLIEKTNIELLKDYLEYSNTDGQILFFGIINTNHYKKVREVLFNELKEDEYNKNIYLYADDYSLSNFEEVNFKKIKEKKIKINTINNEITFNCYLCDKKI